MSLLYYYNINDPINFIDSIGLEPQVYTNFINYACSFFGGCYDYQMPVIDIDLDVGYSYGYTDKGYEITEGNYDEDDLSLPEVGIGVSFCIEIREPNACSIDNSPEDFIGLKRLGISYSDRKTCLNIGPGIGFPFNHAE